VWGTNNNNGAGREIVIELAAPIDIGRIAIDPGAGCGDDLTAALAKYEVLVGRTPGGSFQSLAAGEFQPNQIHGMNEVYSSQSGALGVRYVKLLAKTPQDASDGEDGEHFIDVTELHVARTPGSALGAAANTGAAQSIGSNGATLTGSVVPHDGATELFFDYGTTPSYGSPRVSVGSVPAGTAAVPVTVAIGGLQPSTRYYFRLVAQKNGREYHGGGGTFVTAAAPQPPPTSPPPTNPPPTNPPPTNPPPSANVRATDLLDGSLRANRKGFFKVRTFFGDAAPAGDARFTVLNKRGKRLARATTPVRPGSNVAKTLRLNRRGRKAIKPGRSKRITLELRLPNGQKLKASLRLSRRR
jgi:hypothetical protein